MLWVTVSIHSFFKLIYNQEAIQYQWKIQAMCVLIDGTHNVSVPTNFFVLFIFINKSLPFLNQTFNYLSMYFHKVDQVYIIIYVKRIVSCTLEKKKWFKWSIGEHSSLRHLIIISSIEELKNRNYSGKKVFLKFVLQMKSSTLNSLLTY